MRRILLPFLVLALMSSAATADHITLLLDGKPLPLTNVTVTLTAGPNGEITLIGINGGVLPTPTPDPIPPVVTDDLLDTMKKATTAVQDYTAKDEDARSIAFSINYVAPYLKGTAKASDVTAILKTMSNSSMGVNAGKWTNWWSTFDGATSNMTIVQYKAALEVATTALTADSNFSSGEFMGSESFGLDPTKLMKLLEFILKYLPMILALFA